jgi:glycosyltransferase involved in cell wall biosynthesis
VRIAILHQGFVPDYRVRFFEHLGRAREVEYVVFHGQPPSGTGHRAAPGPFAFANVAVANRELRVAGKALLYQPAVREVAGPRFDGAVLGAELGLLANTVLFGLLKSRGRGVVLWGQGGEKAEDRGRLGGLVSTLGSRLKLAAAGSADGYIAYTAGGRQRLLAAGLDPDRVFVVGNTLDVEGEIELHGELAEVPEQQLRKELGLRPGSVVLLFLGRVYAEKRLGELVEVLRELRRRGLDADTVEAVAIGDGPDLDRVRAAAGDLGGLHFLGELREREQVARYMRVAAALAIPGKVGLAANHAFAHGVPAITRAGDLHAPEFEYLDPTNSIVVEGGLDRYTAAIAEFVARPERRRELAAGALVSREDLTVAAMAAAFHAAVCRIFAIEP